jgi:hypothetical protein
MDSKTKLMTFAMRALAQIKNHRSYALTDESKASLAVLAAALKQDRAARNLTDDDEPTAQSQMVALLERLAKAGCNLIQQRPEGEAKPLPKLWTHPLTGQLLGVPKTPEERSVLARHDPELLDLLDQLDKHPYPVTQKLREAEAKRAALAEFSYEKNEHDVNPWRSGNVQMQNAAIKSSPAELIAFYQAEARDAEIRIFGTARNLTIEGQAAKGDPDTSAILKAAQKIHETWRAQDKAAAEQAAHGANAALQRLEAAT